jgi:hypothetical protein
MEGAGIFRERIGLMTTNAVTRLRDIPDTAAVVTPADFEAAEPLDLAGHDGTDAYESIVAAHVTRPSMYGRAVHPTTPVTPEPGRVTEIEESLRRLGWVDADAAKH